MRPLPRLAWAYIGSVAAVSLILLVSLFPANALGKPEGLALAAVAILILLITETHQVPICSKTSITVSSAVIFAIILLVGPGLAAWIVTVGMALAYLYLKRRWYNVVFNVAAYALTVAGSGFVYRLIDTGTAVSLVSLSHLAALVMAGAAYFVINSGLVAGIVALREGRPWTDLWLEASRHSGAEYAAMICLGILAAFVYQSGWWALILIVLPLFMVYRSLRLQPHPA